MSTATNGAATVAPAEEAYAAAQRAGIVAEDRTEREKESWRRVATIEALALGPENAFLLRVNVRHSKAAVVPPRRARTIARPV